MSCASNLSHLVASQEQDDSNSYQYVQCTTIDNMVDKYGLNLMFIRMDAEGMKLRS